MKRCRACGSTYDSVAADGFLFFHACPPLSVAELLALVPGLDIAAAQAMTFVERDGHRDENLRVDDAGNVVIVSEGAGVDDLPDVALTTAPALLRSVADVVAFVKARGVILPVQPLPLT